MKAIKSDLVKRLEKAGVRIPLKNGSTLVFEGKKYIVNIVNTRQG